MSANVEAVAEVHPTASSSNSPKISMFKRKAGFVIPKNKFSGSLVPVFRGGKKTDSSDSATEENSKQSQRKTKWGPDLTQDISVRRGRALAYQTRVDQITQLLKLGSLSGDVQAFELAEDVQDRGPTSDIDYEKLKTLELERREAIGEILKLNPSYKAPSDYQPVTREATVPIPVKDHPGFNFIGLVYGPDGDTHKRLEKETGTKMQIYGIKTEKQEKVEITASDSIEVLSSCDELYVRIEADSYEKVDAAATLMELLLSSVPGKSAASEAPASASGESMQVVSEGQDLGTISAVNAPTANQEPAQAFMGPTSTPSQGPFQQFQGSWFPAGQSNMPSGVGPGPGSMAFPVNPSPPTQPMFTHRPAPPYGFGPPPNNIQMGPPRPHPPAQGMQGPLMPPNNFGQTGPRNHSGPMPPLMAHQPIPGPQLGERPLNPPMNSPSPGWAMPPPGGASLNPPSQGGPTSGSFLPSQIHSSSAMPMPVQSFNSQAPMLNPPNTLLRPGPIPAPPSPASRPQSGMQNPAPVGPPLNAPSFTPLKPMGGPNPSPTPRPPVPNSNDFTFLPQRPQGPTQSHGPGVHFGSQRPTGASQPQLPPPPQAPSFRPALQQNTMPHQNFPRPQMGPHPGQFGPPSPNTPMGPRGLGPPPQRPNAGGPFPPRLGHSPQYQQSYPGPRGQPGGPFVTNQHSNPSGRTQVYDPFSPTVAPPTQGNNTSVGRKQESDPEYEDLMASVGVK